MEHFYKKWLNYLTYFNIECSNVSEYLNEFDSMLIYKNKMFVSTESNNDSWMTYNGLVTELESDSEIDIIYKLQPYDNNLSNLVITQGKLPKLCKLVNVIYFKKVEHNLNILNHIAKYFNINRKTKNCLNMTIFNPVIFCDVQCELPYVFYPYKYFPFMIKLFDEETEYHDEANILYYINISKSDFDEEILDIISYDTCDSVNGVIQYKIPISVFKNIQNDLKLNNVLHRYKSEYIV